MDQQLPSPTSESTASPGDPGAEARKALAFLLRDDPDQETPGRYDRRKVHGVGGIGRVWDARDAAMQRRVALKELRPELQHREDLRARLRNEARIIGQLQHPGIVPIYELTQGADDPPSYTMRLVEGRALQERVRDYHEQGRSPAELHRLLQALESVCRTLAYAHSRGVIHRDLKGGNIVLGEYGQVIVLDWGAAKVVGAPENTSDEPAIAPPGLAEPTGAGTVIGTCEYMAPEQARGLVESLDARADVFGLGAILYAVLTGRPPYHGQGTGSAEQRADALRQAQEGNIVPPRRRVSAVSRPLEAICLKALAFRPEDRYASAGAMADDVANWLAGEPVSAWPEPWADRLRRWLRRHRTAAAAMAAALLVALTAAAAGRAYLNHREAGRRAEVKKREARARELLARAEARRAEAWQGAPGHRRARLAEALAAALEARALLHD